MHTLNAQETKEARSLSQTRKVHFRSEENQVSWSNPQRRDHPNGSGESQRSGGLVTPMKRHGHTLIFGIHRILSLLHTELLAHRQTHDPANVKKCPIQLGSILHLCVQTSQITNVCKTNTTTT